MRVRALSPQGVIAEVIDRIIATPGDAWVRVAVDGAPATGPDRWAEALVDPLRTLGRPVLRISTAGFLRAASLRLERGRTNPDAYYEDWLDESALRRTVLDPLGPGGGGLVLPSLLDPVTDRATRAAPVLAAPGTVLLLSGALLLGGCLPVDLAVHLSMGAPALLRHTDPAEHWTLPAFERYRTEVNPEGFADVVVRLDDPRRPAVVDR